MSGGIPYADIIILALVAIFILLRLRSVLGDRAGHENNYFRPPTMPAKPEPVVQLDEKALKNAKAREETDTYLLSLGEGPITDCLRKIKEIDAQFTATAFLQGARLAFEMVFDAFAKGDKQTLKMLMSEAVCQHFSQVIDSRAQPEDKAETTLVSVRAKDIIQAALDKNVARLSVRFESEQITVMRNPRGEITGGDPSAIHHVEDHWVFERDVTSKNPNWKIIET